MKSILLIFLMSCSIALIAQNSLVINSNTNINVTGNSSIHLKDTKLTNNGSFNNPSGTVVIEGSAATSLTTIGGINPTTFYNLVINKSANDAALTQTVNISNNLNLESGKIEIANFNLFMGNNATISNINKDRYIKTNGTGMLQRKVGNSFVVFPIGKATFNPARLKNIGTIDIFNIRVEDHLLQDGTSGASLTTNVVPKTWFISENVVGGSDVTMRLIWRPVHSGSGFDANASQITHYTSGYWNDLGVEATSTADNSYSSDHKYREASNITSFSPFGVKSGSSLPVELLYFYGEKIGKQIELSWQTATELNNDYFDVEWSTNGIDFKKIGQIKGGGTTNNVQFYDFVHPNPVKGNNYYRLRQVDFDKKYEYTNTINITIEENNKIINIYPNPTTHYLNIESEDLIGETMQLFNVNGQLIKAFQHQSVHTNLSIMDIPSGTYFIKMRDQIKRLIIQR